MKKDEWLRDSANLLYQTASGYNIRDVWRDFLLWAAHQASYKTNESKLQQRNILDKYPSELHESFRHLYLMVSYVVSQWPNQNVLLKIMDAVHIAGQYYYDEAAAKEILLSKLGIPLEDSCRWRQMEMFDLPSDNAADWENVSRHQPDDSIDFENFWSFGRISFIDDCCAITGGSRLIAVANVYRENCPMDFQNRMMLIGSDAHDTSFALMSFIQMSIMGMACYVLTDSTYSISLSCGMELFAPPTAICSAACCSEAWHQARLQAIMAAQLGSEF